MRTRKLTRFFLALAVAFALFGVLNLLWMGLSAMERPAAGDWRLLKKLSNDVCVDVTGGQIAFYEDTHGGFHGDGDTFLTVAFDADAAPHIAAGGAWSALPLTDDLATAAYGRYELRDGGGYFTGPLATDGDGACYFPTVETGYYFFKDRFADAAGSQRDGSFLDRGCYNFTLALYDADRGTLYYYELDT